MEPCPASTGTAPSLPFLRPLLGNKLLPAKYSERVNLRRDELLFPVLTFRIKADRMQTDLFVHTMGSPSDLKKNA